MLTVKQIISCINMPHPEIAKCLDVHENTLANWLSGKTDIGLSKYHELLQFASENINRTLAASALQFYFRDTDMCFISRDRNHPSYPGGVLVDPYRITAAYAWGCFELLKENVREGRFPTSEELVKSLTKALQQEQQFNGEIMTLNQYNQIEWPEELKKFKLDVDLNNDYPFSWRSQSTPKKPETASCA